MRVETVVGVTCVGGPALAILVATTLQNTGGNPAKNMPTTQMVVGVVGLVAACLCLGGEESNTLPAARWLLPWFVCLALERACDSVQSTAEGGITLPQDDIVLVENSEPAKEGPEGMRAKMRARLLQTLEAIQGASGGGEDSEMGGLCEEPQARGVAGMSAAERLFYSNALPILPVALLAVLFQEGSLFTDAELHVHSVSMLGYSVLASTGLALSSVLLKSSAMELPAQRFNLGLAGTRLATLALVIQERDDELNLEGLISAMVCVLAGTIFIEWPFKSK
mmetsp:Transcript_34663/g.48050  ORF Transcript_34663/g.48050 Transcript_34663/m.48050 type:complete len:280 (-) Transcript_34663:135-974(-)